MTTPAQLSAAPPNDPSHPAVVDRLCKDMLATAAVLDSMTAQSFAADEPWKALQFLRQSIEGMSVEAEMYRPDVPQG